MKDLLQCVRIYSYGFACFCCQGSHEDPPALSVCVPFLGLVQVLCLTLHCNNIFWSRLSRVMFQKPFLDLIVDSTMRFCCEDPDLVLHLIHWHVCIAHHRPGLSTLGIVNQTFRTRIPSFSTSWSTCSHSFPFVIMPLAAAVSPGSKRPQTPCREGPSEALC